MNQILLGAAFPFLLALLMYACRRARAPLWLLLWTPYLMALSALWAVAPDLPRLLGNYALYDRLSLDPRMNMFYWHYSIDMTESDSPWYALGLVLMLAGLLAAAWRELHLAEKT
jgi:hypothetical protein